MRSNAGSGPSVLVRGFSLLIAFQAEDQTLGLAELARRVDLPKATVFRLAGQLVSIGALERSGDAYRLGLRLFELGAMVARQRILRDTALPVMQDLYEATHESVHLAVRDGLDVLYVEKISGRKSAPAPTRVGTRRPLYCTALGKAILAFSGPDLTRELIGAGFVRYTPYTATSPTRLLEALAHVRNAGVAYDRGEYHVSTVCVAAPLLDADGLAHGSLSVTGRAGRFRTEKVAAAVRSAADVVSRAVAGGWGGELDGALSPEARAR